MCTAVLPAGKRWVESEENRIQQKKMKRPISKVATWHEAALMLQLAQGMPDSWDGEGLILKLKYDNKVQPYVKNIICGVVILCPCTRLDVFGLM